MTDQWQENIDERYKKEGFYVTGNGRYKALYYQHDREDDEAICRECSQKKNREIEQSVVDVDIWKFEK